MNVTQNNVAEQPTWSLRTHPFRSDIRLLFLAALIVFIITVLIGLVNGQRILQLSGDVVLTHVHSGTIGWITLSVFAISLWLFGSDNVIPPRHPFIHWSSIIAAVFVPLYILAFLSGNFIARAVLGVPVLAVMAAFFGWVIYRSGKVRIGVAHLAILASLLTLVLGALLGVLLQFQFATSSVFLPGGAFGAHPAGLVAGYLILIGMALSEWRLQPPRNRVSRWGIAQIVLLFLAGLALAIGTLLDLTPLYGINTLCLVIGTIIYVVRTLSPAARVNWLTRNSDRFFAVSGVFIVIDTVLTVYLSVSLIIGAFPNGEIPQGLLTAIDHTVFIGVMTNALFGLILDVTIEEQRSFWPWADQVLFWGMNIGVLGFIFALLTDIRSLENVFTPIMGLSILLAIIVYLVRLIPGQSNTNFATVQSGVEKQV
jgi:hypothetical protein